MLTLQGLSLGVLTKIVCVLLLFCCIGRFIDQPLANYYAAQVTRWQEDRLLPADMTAEVSSSSDADGKIGRGTSV